MDQYTLNRFEYLNTYSKEELEKLKQETIEDLNHLLEKLEDANTSSEEKSEIRNSDLKYDRELLEYIEYLKEEKHPTL